ncbi:MAG TPA: PEP/pyruvate-binding domain-containing protein [Candidatus Hydrogenedentes bacterium]|nr:PEP/pyruvate-binding domain-containing protein [Candidatus Hydrogenedentota bacterium]HPG66843.1 PEP/pyruvate-binding domain-containing protein [Candidatus Hydrogenedentota bacterium]
MAQVDAHFSTGLPELDRLLKGVIPGDNIVWQVESIDDYSAFVKPFYEQGLASGRTVVYFRFAQHAALVPEDAGVRTYVLDPSMGFEHFLLEIHRAIEQAGRGAYYVFDCISTLAVEWYSDQMLGNFFMLTCPYLFDLETVTYFALLRNTHSMYATTPITRTTQLLLDVFRHRDRLYVHPLKVQQRYSPTMHMFHEWRRGEFAPVSESYTISDVLASRPRAALDSAGARLGVWTRAFVQAQEILDNVEQGVRSEERARAIFQRLLRMVVSRDERVLRLAERYLSLRDILALGRRMIGTGRVGGKTVGMLLARAIIEQREPRWRDHFEVHDSFYIASDVFYTFLVHNGCWWMRLKQKDPNDYLNNAERGRQRILMGNFPEYIVNQFANMLDYFGQSPIIVRSSSLLEDNFGNSFAGKYESIFCANQGSRDKCLEDFISAVKTIYASTMSEKALSYRARRGLLDRDEQMALLVQRVSGSLHGNFFYPQIAGVGFSFNPYVWSDDIDPEAGILRLVFGLGTRAVDRADQDYTRIVALNAPTRRPESSPDDVRRYAQRKVDVLDLEGNQLISADFPDVVRQCPHQKLDLFVSRDSEAERIAREQQLKGVCTDVLTFDRLLADTSFVADMSEMLRTLQEAYENPVDIEFTCNFLPDGQYRINLVQCRPLQVKAEIAMTDRPGDVNRSDVVVETRGPIIGQSRLTAVDRCIYVVPSVYGQMPLNERYGVARCIGKLMHLDEPDPPETIMLIGPGRWGTTTPSLGVPVSFAEINTVSVLCEIVAMRDDLVPDVSLGTHFFSELVEMEILYLAVFPNQEKNVLAKAFFEEQPNRVTALLPEAAPFERAIRVFDPAKWHNGRSLKVYAHTPEQNALCYVDRAKRSIVGSMVEECQNEEG